MAPRMLCRKCNKITQLRVEDMHYKGGDYSPSTILYVQTCCKGKSRWTKDYLIRNKEYKFTDYLDKNGC